MSIDKGSTVAFNAAFPIAGIPQPSKGLRDNFAIIKKAIERLQSMESGSDSLFDIVQTQHNDGSIVFDIRYTNNSFVLPIGDPDIAPVVGMVRYHDGFMQVYNGTGWNLVSGPALQDILDALENSAAWSTLTPARHGNLPGGSLHDLAVAGGAAGFISGADKAKLDALTPGFGQVSVRSSLGIHFLTPGSSTLQLRANSPLTLTTEGSEIVFGIDANAVQHGIQPGGNLHALAQANGAAGFLSGSDKAKLDKLVTVQATVDDFGYMSAADKVKLNGLATAFTQIAVAGGPLLASSGNTSLTFEASNGLEIHGVLGTPNRLLFALNNIGGYTPQQVAALVSNFNTRNDRDGSAIPAPFIPQDASGLSHTLNSDGSANISMAWRWAGSEASIDGFIVTIHAADTSDAYVLGSAPYTEQTFVLAADRRSTVLGSVAPDKYYSLYVKAFRTVDPDIIPGRVIYSENAHGTAPGQYPYQPETHSVFTGDVTGSLNGTPVPGVLQSITDASKTSTWDGVSGANKPKDNADVTAQNTSLNTLNVGTQTAAQLLATLTNLGSGLSGLSTKVDGIISGDGTFTDAAKAYADAAARSATQADTAASAAQAARDASTAAIQQTQTYLDGQVSAAQAAVDLANLAKSAAQASANASALQSSAAGNSATAASGSADLALTHANEAGSYALNAHASVVSAIAAVAYTRPSDFSADATYFTGFILSSQGVTFQTVDGIGRTYRQTGTGPAWLTALQPFVTVQGHRLRATVRFRYVADGVSLAAQKVGFQVMGMKSDATYEVAAADALVTVAGAKSSGVVKAADGWLNYTIDLIPTAALAALYGNITIGFVWNNDPLATGTIEIASLALVDVTESARAADAASSAITTAQATLAYQTQAGQYAQAAQQSAVSAQTSAGQALTSKNDAASSASDALGSKNIATTQAGIATQASLSAQGYTNAAAGYSSAASSSADKASVSSTAAQSSAVSAAAAYDNSRSAARASVQYNMAAQSYANDAQTYSLAAQSSSVSAIAALGGALSAAQGNILRKGSFADGQSGGLWTGLLNYQESSTDSRVVDCTEEGIPLPQTGEAEVALFVNTRDIVEGDITDTTGGANSPWRLRDWAGRTLWLIGYVSTLGSTVPGWFGLLGEKADGTRYTYFQQSVPANTGWTAINYTVKIDAGVVRIAPWLHSDGTADTTSVLKLYATGLIVADITESTNAGLQASAAASSASDASGFASQANGYAAQANSAAVLASQIGPSAVNKNPYFGDITWGQSSIPPSWTEWNSAPSGIYMGKNLTPGTTIAQPSNFSPFALQIDRNNSQHGVLQQITGVNPGFWTVDIDVGLSNATGGGWSGAGVLIYNLNESQSVLSSVVLAFGSEPPVGRTSTTPNVGGRYQFSKTWEAPAGTTRFNFYLMNGYNGIGDISGTLTTIWFKALIRAASAGDPYAIAANATIVALNQTVADNKSATATSLVTLSSRFSGVAASNVNPTFDGWQDNSVLPIGWGYWDATVAVNRVAGVNGHPFAAYYNVPANQIAGLVQVIQLGFGAYVIELTGRATDWQGAGVLAQFRDASLNVVSQALLNASTVADTSGFVSNNGNGSASRSFSLFTQQTNQNITNILFYCMANWDGFGAKNVKQIYFDKVSIRPASAAEIAGQTALSTANQAAADITTINRTITNNDSAYAARMSTIEATYRPATVNLLLNSNFKDNFTAWGQVGSRFSPRYSNWLGSYAHCEPDSAGDINEYINQDVFIDQGIQYTLSILGAASGSPRSLYLVGDWIAFDGSIAGRAITLDISNIGYAQRAASSLSGTAPSNANRMRVYIASYKGGGYLEFTQVQLQAGAATSWRDDAQARASEARIAHEESARATAESAQATTNSTLTALVMTAPNMVADVDKWALYNGAGLDAGNSIWGQCITTGVTGGETDISAFEVNVSSNQTYCYSADMIAFGSGNYTWIDIQWLRSDRSTIRYSNRATLNGPSDFSNSRPRLFVADVAPGDATSARLRVCGKNVSSVNGFRRPKFERGSTPTGYTMEGQTQNLAASVSTQAGAISNLQGRTSAYWTTTTVAGNNRAQLSIHADANGGAGVDIIGDVSISGSLLVGGTVNTAQLAAQSVTSFYAIANPNSYVGSGASTTPVSGGGGGGGSFGCVAVESYMPFNLRASDISTGSPLLVLNDSDDGYVEAKAEAASVINQHCYRLTTVNGVTVIASNSTPITTRGGRTVSIMQSGGLEIPTIVNGAFIWDRVARIDYLGPRDVMLITVHDGVYAAGEVKDRYVMTHNKTQN